MTPLLRIVENHKDDDNLKLSIIRLMLTDYKIIYDKVKDVEDLTSDEVEFLYRIQLAIDAHKVVIGSVDD
jgi:hypothetical protein